VAAGRLAERVGLAASPDDLLGQGNRPACRRRCAIARRAADRRARSRRRLQRQQQPERGHGDVVAAGDQSCNDGDDGPGLAGASRSDLDAEDGRYGDQVSALQRALASLGFSPGKVDGVYGPSTKSAVEQFQRSVNITADGIVGPETLGALKTALGGQ
jgi:murein L,D-transpeptidase YcbB/YkuD